MVSATRWRRFAPSGGSGEALTDQSGFLTALSLATYADDRVRQWVRDNRPTDTEQSRGITVNLEGPAASIPLAVDAVHAQYRSRRRAALEIIRQNIGRYISGSSENNSPSWVLRTYFGNDAGHAGFNVGTQGLMLLSNELESATTITDGAYHLVYGTYDGSIVKLYIDGVLEASSPRSGSIK